MITVTEEAAKRINQAIQHRGKGEGIRIRVKTSGCSGYAYQFEFCDAIENDDSIFEGHDATVIIDQGSLPFLDGTEIDYVFEDLKEGFKLSNPNLESSCGCGESFSVKT